VDAAHPQTLYFEGYLQAKKKPAAQIALLVFANV